MAIHELAGKRVPASMLVDVDGLISAYFKTAWSADNPLGKVAFGTSGHRGSSINGSFTEPHILAIAQAVCDYRTHARINGPLFLGKDTHALSEPASVNALEVFAANGVDLFYQEADGPTPTPAVSHAILTFNRGRTHGLADGIILTPSHNPPEDGGIKYNPPNGGPADTDVTSWIEERANILLLDDLRSMRRMTIEQAMRAAHVQPYDFMRPYVGDLENVIDMKAIAGSGLRIGADPLGGAGIAYWDPIAERYGLDLTVVNKTVDSTFSFMRVDRDGKIRMDCSSPYAMAGLIEMKDSFDIAFGNDPDFDRHGIVTCSSGLLNPNHYLSVAINYLFQHRADWPGTSQIGKTLVSSSMIDRVGSSIGRQISEVPVGFKWFVDGLLSGTLGFGGEESAGASFLRKDGSVWTTDKDGIILNLLAAEITAVTGRDPGEHYASLTERFGNPVYARSDALASNQQKAVLKNMRAEDVPGSSMAGDPIIAKLTRAPGNDAEIGGLKVVTERGWFAARPSGTEDLYKIYAESFVDETHLSCIQSEARTLIDRVFEQAGVKS